mgnify:CR=1
MRAFNICVTAASGSESHGLQRMVQGGITGTSDARAGTSSSAYTALSASTALQGSMHTGPSIPPPTLDACGSQGCNPWTLNPGYVGGGV